MSSQPISLYLDLEPGEQADLVVVANASLAFAAAVKELAYILDPSLDLRIELASGTEGSLSLNSVLRAVKEKVTDPEVLRTIVVVIIVWFATETADWAYHKILDEFFGPTSTLSDADMKKISDMVTKILDGHVAQPQVQKVYRELERDPAIKGVGASPKPGARPRNIVPKAEFPSRGGYSRLEEKTIERRERTDRETVTLVSPVLLAGSRRWRFVYREGEFGAPIRDESFLENLLSGRILVPMVAGITMDVELQTIEEKNADGVWEPIERNILRVDKLAPASSQPSFPFPRPRPPQADDGGAEN
jgi:hypothetical protein